MNNQSSTPITDEAEKKLQLKMQAIAGYSDNLTAFFADKIKASFIHATMIVEKKQNELIQQSHEISEIENLTIINPEEPTDNKTGATQNGNE